MDIGIFAKTFPRKTLDATLDAVRMHGLKYVQFNMACVGLPSMPEEIHGGLRKRIRRARASSKETNCTGTRRQGGGADTKRLTNA